MKSSDLLNTLIELRGYTRYLEIGSGVLSTSSEIECDEVYTVEPHPRPDRMPTHHMSSDAFFKQNRKKYDLIFLDGDHRCEQFANDFSHSLRYLRDGGCIVAHDVYPRTEQMSLVPRITREWTGDIYKEWTRIVASGMPCVTVCENYGWGIYHEDLPCVISDVPKGNELNYRWWQLNRSTVLNPITASELYDTLQIEEV